MINLRVVIVLIAVAASLTACDPPAEFSAPISEPGGVEYDKRLIGSWYALAEGNEDYTVIHLNIGVSREGLLNVVAITPDNRPDRDADEMIFWLAATAWPSEIDGKIYYNIQRKTGFGNYGNRWKEIYETIGKPGFIVARAAFFDDDTLRLKVISSEKIAALIRGGRGDGGVPGKVYRAEFRISSWVDIGGAELQTLIRSDPEEQLFRLFPFWVNDDPRDFSLKRLKPTYRIQ